MGKVPHVTELWRGTWWGGGESGFELGFDQWGTICPLG